MNTATSNEKLHVTVGICQKKKKKKKGEEKKGGYISYSFQWNKGARSPGTSSSPLSRIENTIDRHAFLYLFSNFQLTTIDPISSAERTHDTRRLTILSVPGPATRDPTIRQGEGLEPLSPQNSAENRILRASYDNFSRGLSNGGRGTDKPNYGAG